MGFAIPYNGIDYKKYIEYLEKYKEYIDYVYIADNPVFKDKDRNISYTILQNDKGKAYYEDCRKFLENRPSWIPVYLDITEYIHNDDGNALRAKIDKILIKELDDYHIDGIITTDYGIASIVNSYGSKEKYYNIIIYGLSNLRAMYSYEEDLNVSDFILPVDTLRNRAYVEYLKKLRFDYKKNTYDAKLQAVINNSEYYGNTSYNMSAYNVFRIRSMRYNQWYRPYDAFRKNWVLPRWLKIYDDFIETYVLEGLYEYTVERIFQVLDNYVHIRDDIKLSDIVDTELKDYPVNKISNKLSLCMCMECGVSCTNCKERLNKYYEEKGIDINI